MKKFIETSKLMLWLVCAAALLFTGISLVTPSPIASVKAAGDSSEGGRTFEYSYTGSIQEISLTSGEYTFELWGANGGDRKGAALGGIGGYSKGQFVLEATTTLYLGIGGFGGSSTTNLGSNVLGPAGFNGGGQRFGFTGGGGATHIAKTANRGVLSAYVGNQEDVIIVAGGGGSVGAVGRIGGNGGGETGVSTTQSYGSGGQGGTQAAGGAGNTSYPLTKGTFGQGGQGYYYANGYSGAGGGGWYGGAAAYPDGSVDDDRGGGGGSGYIGGVTSDGFYAQATEAGFVANPDVSGNGFIRIFKKCVTYTFMFGEQEFDSLEEDFGETTVVLPTETPEKIGYVFKGWKDVTVTQNVYQPGVTYANSTGFDVMFEATFTEALFDVEFNTDVEDAALMKGVSEIDKIKIGDTGLSLFSDPNPWASGHRWAVKYPGTDGDVSQDWLIFNQVVHAGTAPLKILENYDAACIEFIENFVEKYPSHTSGNPEDPNDPGNSVGKITFKVVDISDFYEINVVSNLPEAGKLLLSVNNAASISAEFNKLLSLPTNGARVTSLSATVKDHYRFVSFEILNGAGVVVGAPIKLEDDISDDDRFILDSGDSEGLKEGFSIRVNYEKIEYNFVTTSALKGQENVSLDLIDSDYSDPIFIGEATSFNILALSQSINERYKFVAWKIYNHVDKVYEYYTKGVLGFSRNFIESDISVSWLNKYMKDDVVTIIAEYAEAYHVTVSVLGGQENCGFLEVKVYDALTDIYTDIPLKDLDMYLISGSFVELKATANEFYEFDRYTFVNGSLVSNYTEYKEHITDDFAINAIFRPIAYTVIFEAKDSKGFEITSNDDKYYIKRNNSATQDDKISLADILNIMKEDVSLLGYRLDSFSIIDADGEEIFDPTNLIITEEILLNNFNPKKEFVITVNYTRLYTLNLSVNSSEMGTALVYTETAPGSNVFNTDATSERVFPIGTKLRIVADPSDDTYFDIDYFWIGYVQTGGYTVEITLDSTRPVIVYFKTIAFAIETELNKVEITGTTNNLKVDDSVVLTASPKSGEELKKWTINGVSVKDLAKNPAYEVTVSNNAVTIKLTTNWLNEFGREINSEAKFGMPTATETMILITAIAVPLLLAIFLFYFINLRRKTALIKKELQEEFKAKQKFGTSSLLKDLREGKEIGVTDEAVKKAMKEKKKKPDTK